MENIKVDCIKEGQASKINFKEKISKSSKVKMIILFAFFILSICYTILIKNFINLLLIL